MPGFGLAPCGQFPCGFGAPATGTTLSAPTFLGARRIDPLTGDYVVDQASGQFEQVTAAEQLIVIKLGSRKGSGSALPNLGILIPLELDENTEREVRQEILAAMKPDIEAGVLEIRDTRVIAVPDVTGGQARIEVDWVDLTTGKTGTTPINA